jgi:hypothetical protein
MLTDEEFKAAKRELLSGLKGKERRAQAWWIDCLYKAGVPIYAHFGRYPGPRDIAELRERLADDDFDKSGFSIVGTLRRSTRRYRFSNGHASRVIDLGLRIEDVDGLETEDVYFANEDAVRNNLHLNGATPEEIEFLLQQRVEINAFASDELVEWLEDKLAAHGIKKVIPDERTLAAAYQRMRQQALVQRQINELLAGLGSVDEIAAPDRLARRIRKLIKADPLLPWDEALRQISEEES